MHLHASTPNPSIHSKHPNSLKCIRYTEQKKQKKEKRRTETETNKTFLQTNNKMRSKRISCYN